MNTTLETAQKIDQALKTIGTGQNNIALLRELQAAGVSFRKATVYAPNGNQVVGWDVTVRWNSDVAETFVTNGPREQIPVEILAWAEGRLSRF